MAPTKEENGDDSQSSTPEYRDRLRTWLIKMIDSGTIPGLQWENDEKTIFRMPWKHAGRQDYSLEEDSRIFMAWAIHSGRYREGIDKPEPIIWKTRLRCALNKMPDIREIPERSRLDISEPYRVYHLLPPVHKDTQIRRRHQRRHSHVQSSDSSRLSSQQTSPSFPRKEPTTPNSATLKFPDLRFPGRPSDTSTGINHHGITHPPRFDIRNAAPWLPSTPLIPNAENRLLQGLNLNSFTSQVNMRNLVNPYGLFSMPPRDLRQRSEFDFPVFPYQNPILDHQHLNPFFMPPSSIGSLQLPGKPTVTGTSFSRSLALAASAAEEMQARNKTNKIRADEKDDAKCKIELLELEITKWKHAYEKEKSLRESVERKHDHLKNSLENMGGDILAIIKRGYPFRDQAGGVDSEMDNKSNSVKARRRSTDDKNVRTELFRDDVAENHRTGRHSAGERLDETNASAKNDWSPLRGAKRKSEDDDFDRMDLSDHSATTKRSRVPSNGKDQSGRHKFPAYSAHENHDILNKHPQTVREKNERAFRFSASSSRLSSDCDDENATSSANQPLVKSPSTSSSCSSAEESLSGLSHSPSITCSSPAVSMFRASNSNSYSTFDTRVDGPIQVT